MENTIIIQGRELGRHDIELIRRHLFALPGFITVHARRSTVRLIGGGAENLRWFDEYWKTLSRC